MSSTVHRDEKQIIDACVRGDEQSWNRFVHEYGRLIRHTVSKLSSNNSLERLEKEDLEAYVYEKLLDDACRRLSAWRGKSKFSTYLVQVTRNLALDAVKKKNREVRVPNFDDIPDWLSKAIRPEDEDLKRVRMEALKEAITNLPKGQAIIIRMRLEGKSLRDIAKIINKPVGTVSVENSRALEGLRRAMRSVFPENKD